MDISIIIPIFNVEEYLAACLESVKKNITGFSAEVLLIDDGSEDNSSVIAKKFAEKNKAFKYFRTENRGLGAARNYGVTLATGKYLFFLDSDDLLADGILAKMFTAAERNQTDLTICYVVKLKDKKVLTSDIHLRAFHNLRGTISHIKKHPAFVFDSTAWNKLILRSFYLKNEFSFPEGFLFEDIPTIIPMHYCANGVTVIRSTGYFWRIRTGDTKQISMQLTEKRNLTDKIAMLIQCLKYVRKKVAEPAIEDMLEAKILNDDFTNYFNELYRMEDTKAKEYVNLIADFVRTYIRKESLKKLSVKNQQIFKDVLNEDIEHLRQVINYKNVNYNRAPFIDSANGIQIKLPENIFTIHERSICNEFTLNPPNSSVDFATVTETSVCLQGRLYFRRINVPDSGAQTVSSYLLNEITGRTENLQSGSFHCPYLTEEQGIVMNYDDYKFYRYNYDWAGFEVEIDFNRLNDESYIGDNHIILTYANRYFSGERILRGVNNEIKKKLEKFTFSNEKYIGKFKFDKQNTVAVFIQKKKTPEPVVQAFFDASIKVSVIIPVYNVAQYLEQCIESVLNQTLKEIEIICVDDGSTDRSLAILEGYAQKDPRIIVIHQQNRGAGAARNAGLQIAKGEYLSILDADDFFEPKMLETCTRIMDQDGSDISVYMASEFDNKTGKYSYLSQSVREEYCIDHSPFAPQEMTRYLLNTFGNWPWNKMFRHSFVKVRKLSFQEIPRANDVAFVSLALVQAGKISIIKEKLANYRINSGRSLQQTNDKTPLAFWDAYLETKKRLIQTGLYDKYEQSFLNNVLGNIIYNLNSVHHTAAYRDILAMVKYRSPSDFGITDKPLNYYYNLNAISDYCKMRARVKPATFPVKSPKVSAIIPTNNSRNYIRECIESVLEQTLREIEVICVDAGSDDGTREILKEYEALDKRVSVITVDQGHYNQLISQGISVAQGEYLAIVDSHDFIVANMFKDLYRIAETHCADIIKADFQIFLGEKNNYKYKYCKILSDNKYYDKIIDVCKTDKAAPVFNILWEGLYKRKFLKENEVKLSETKNGTSDEAGLWVLYYAVARRVYFCNKSFYRFRIDVSKRNMDSKYYIVPKIEKSTSTKIKEEDPRKIIERKDKELKKLEEQNKSLRHSLDRIKKSKAFYVGEKLAWPVRKLRKLFK